MIRKLGLFRPSVTQIRVTLFVVNLVISVAVIWLFVSRLLEPHDALVAKDLKSLTKKMPATLLAYKASGVPGKRNDMTKLQVSSAFEVEKRIDPNPIVDEKKLDDEVPVVTGEDELAPGPLEDKYEYINGVFLGIVHEDNMAVVQQKQAETKGGARRTSRARKSVSASKARGRSQRRSRSAKGGRRGAQQASNLKMLKIYDRWIVDEDAGLVVWIANITPERLVYEEEGQWVQYALKRKEELIYSVDGKGDLRVTPPVDEDAEEEEKAEEEKSRQERMEIIQIDRPKPKTALDRFNERKTAPQPSTKKKDAATASSRPEPRGVAGRRGKAGVEEMKKFAETYKELKKSKKLSAEDRRELEKLDKIMKGSGKKRN